MIITSGIYKGSKVKAPDEKIVRPTLSQAREGVFNTLFSIMELKGKSFLDMFAGSGIMGLEALSRGFERVIALEQNLKVARILKENYQNINLEPNLIIGDSLRKSAKLNEKFDVIYIDPPYSSGIYEKCLEKIIQHSLLKEEGIVIIEHVNEVKWESFGFKLFKQKNYSNKFITLLSL